MNISLFAMWLTLAGAPHADFLMDPDAKALERFVQEIAETAGPSTVWPLFKQSDTSMAQPTLHRGQPGSPGRRGIRVFPERSPSTFRALLGLHAGGRRSTAFARVDQPVLESCKGSFPAGNLWIGSPVLLTRTLLTCLRSAKLYLPKVTAIQTPLGPVKNLSAIAVPDTLNNRSVRHLLGYRGQMIILGARPPTWLLENITSFKAWSLLLPEVKTLSVNEARQLATFGGSQIKFNGLQSLPRDVAKALSQFPPERRPGTTYSLELRGLNDLSAESFKQLASGRFRLSVRMPDFGPSHVSHLPSWVSISGVTALQPEVVHAIGKMLDDSRSQKLFFPDLRHLEPASYLVLLAGNFENLKKRSPREWQRRQRWQRVTLPLNQLSLNAEWYPVLTAVDTHFWGPDSPNHGALDRWLANATNIKAEDFQSLLDAGLVSSHSLDKLTHITPELAKLLVAAVPPDAPGEAGIRLSGIEDIDAQSFSILLAANLPVFLDGLKNLPETHIQAMLNRSSTAPISLTGLVSMDARHWPALSEKRNLIFPAWLRATPAFQRHHFPRQPKRQRSLAGLPLSIFQSVDFSGWRDGNDALTFRLADVDNLSPAHIKHLKKFPWERLEINARVITSALVAELNSWPHPTTVFRIHMNNAPPRVVSELVPPVEKVEVWDLQHPSPKLALLSQGNISHLSFYRSQLPLPGVHHFRGHTLVLDGLSATSHLSIASYDPAKVDELVRNFKGQSIEINEVEFITPALAKTLVNHPANIDLRVHNEPEPEALLEETLAILRSAERSARGPKLGIQNWMKVCDIPQIESEVCKIDKEQAEAAAYWEHHDCGEDEEEHSHE